MSGDDECGASLVAGLGGATDRQPPPTPYGLRAGSETDSGFYPTRPMRMTLSTMIPMTDVQPRFSLSLQDVRDE